MVETYLLVKSLTMGDSVKALKKGCKKDYCDDCSIQELCVDYFRIAPRLWNTEDIENNGQCDK